MPAGYIFEPTSRCNLNCAMCYQKGERKVPKKELNLAEIKAMFNNLPKDRKSIALIGAEVFMRQDIFPLLKFLEQRKMKAHLSTNGILINQNNVEELKSIKNITGIGYSLDGLREIHNQIRGASFAFDGALNAIKLTKDNFIVSINTVMQSQNLDQILDLAKFLKSLGVNNLSLQFEMFSTPQEIEISKKMMGLKDDEIRAEMKESPDFEFPLSRVERLMEELKKLKINVTVTPALFNKYPREFFNGTLRKKIKLTCKDLVKCRIDSRGNVVFCPMVVKSFGNLLEKPLSEIWNSPEFVDFRRRLLSHNLLPICEKCCRLGLR